MEIKEFIGEVWRPVKGYEGLYEVSNFGRVRSVSRYINGKRGVKVWMEGKILKLKTKRNGRYYVNLSINGCIVTKPVHRLVAEAFIANPLNLPCVNHRDENPLNNCVENLEWCTAVYNCNYGTRNERISLNGKNNPKKSYPVIQYTLDGEFIKKYPSIREAYRQTGIDRRIISNICKGITKQPKQFIWKYAND